MFRVLRPPERQARRPRLAPRQPAPMDCTQQGFVVAGDSASLQSIPVPTPKEGEAVVRVLIAGVCNTDLEIMKGRAAAGSSS